MSQDTEHLTAEFERVFAAPAPPTSVDAAHLVERGHRLLRRRRAAGALSAVATAAAVVLLTTAALPELGAHPGQSDAPGGGTSMLNPARFGWLPKAPDAYDYDVDLGVSVVTAEWANQPAGDDPMLMLYKANANQVMPKVAPMSPYTLAPGDHPVKVGTIDGNPVWYYSYSEQLQNAVSLTDFLLWKTAAGYWAALQDPLVDGPTLLRIAKSANTTPTPLEVPLTTTGDLAKLSSYDVLLAQTTDNDGLEYIVDGNLGNENISITGIDGDTGLTTQNGTKCDFTMITGLGSYQYPCDQGFVSPFQGMPFDSPIPSFTLPTPGTEGYSTTGQGSPFRASSKVLNGIDVYVSVDVDEKYSPSLSEKALNEVTSFGTNPADWQQADFGN